VNLAARLQQAAEPGEILLGPAARRLSAGRSRSRTQDRVEIKGRAEPLWTVRAIRMHDPRRVAAAPFVGREPELELLENVFRRAARRCRAQLVTIFGSPAGEDASCHPQFVGCLERATTLSGRTLPYGEGVTYGRLPR